ncbi:MAG: hypothetical protein Q9216_006224 [Gyalolechia sp. 2 TL-2023]
MIYSINVIHGGFFVGLLAFFVWSLPGCIASYGLSLGIARIGEALPGPVYALLTGINAATVGIIALAAVQLSQKAIKDKLTRILVFLGATAGMLYNALWYFPILIFAGGTATIFWDYRVGQRLLRRFRPRSEEVDRDPQAPVSSMEMGEVGPSNSSAREPPARLRQFDRTSNGNNQDPREENEERIVPAALDMRLFSWKSGITVIAIFFVTFTIIMVLRGVLENGPRGFNLFANLYLAGTIIFGGGPVVIPLLRDSSELNAAAGAVIGYIAIFTPGLTLHTGTMGLWKTLRGYRWVTSCLRGVNASAVGLVYTAVYRLWEIGNIDEAYQSGSSLGKDPWWVVITATSFVGGMWFKLPPPAAILLGGAMGMIWYGVVKM